MGAIGITTTVTTTQEPRRGADGTTWLQVVAHGNLTALTPYIVFPGQTGYVSAAISGAMYGHIGIPEADVDSGDTCWLQIGGRVEDVITASITSVKGQSLTMTTEDVAAGGAAWTGVVGEFAVATEASEATTHDMFLVGEKILTVA